MPQLIPTHYIEAKHKGYWFSQGARRFFRSRVSDTAYLTEDGTRAFFVSSEKGPNGIRAYTVRVADMRTGKIDTYGEFQGYSSRNGAHYAAYRAAVEYTPETQQDAA